MSLCDWLLLVGWGVFGICRVESVSSVFAAFCEIVCKRNEMFERYG